MDSISMQSNNTPVLQEEIAGPAPAFAPIQRQQCFASMDVLRGIALLGILIANVSDFGLPGWDYLVPLSTSKPVFTGPHAAANTAIWFARWLIMEGKMRALFSLLFGAGVILLTGRIEHLQGQDSPCKAPGKPPPLFRIQVANRFGAVMCAEPFLRAPALT